MENNNKKIELIEEIESLMGYSDSVVDRNLLQYMDIESLEAIRDSMFSRHNSLRDDDIEWMKSLVSDD